MKLLATMMLSNAIGFAASAQVDLRVVPQSEPQRVFAGPKRSFTVAWQNTSSETAAAELQMRLVQTSTWTATVIGDSPWKQLHVLPGQTVLEHATLDFPEVRAETRFIVQWISTNAGAFHETRSSGRESAPSEPAQDQSRLTSVATVQGTNLLFGTTELLVYPTNLLTQLKPLAGEDQPVGVFDPANVLKPLLKAVSVEFEDMADSGIADFSGKLAIVGPFTSREQMPGDLGDRIEKLARKGAGVVWLQPPPSPRDKLQPSFRIVPLVQGTVIIVQSHLVSNLADSPQAQLNLIRFCELSRNLEPPELPDHNAQR